jgi:hypothetical protein
MAKMKHIYNDGGRKAAGYSGKAGDCVARSIAIAAQRPYQEVYERLAKGNASQRSTKHSRRKTKSHGVETASHGIFTRRKWFKDYMAELGFVWTPTMQIGSGCKVHLAEGELPMGRIIAAVSRHYCAVIDGVIHDTYNPGRSDSFQFEPDRGQELKPNQGRNENGVWTKVGGRCVYGYWRLSTGSP